MTMQRMRYLNNMIVIPLSYLDLRNGRFVWLRLLLLLLLLWHLHLLQLRHHSPINASSCSSVNTSTCSHHRILLSNHCILGSLSLLVRYHHWVHASVSHRRVHWHWPAKRRRLSNTHSSHYGSGGAEALSSWSNAHSWPD